MSIQQKDHHWNAKTTEIQQLKIDEKAMIRNLYNRIPHPAPNTKRETNVNN